MAKKRRRRYRFKPRFFVIIAVFLIAMILFVKLVIGAVSWLTKKESTPDVTPNNLVIAIDSGHDAQGDRGAVAPGGINEFMLNDAVSKALKEELLGRGYTVIETRKLGSSEQKSLNDRVRLLNERWPDLLISIHHNANEDATVKGFTIIYNNRKTDAYDGRYVKYNSNIYKMIKEENGRLYYKDGDKEKSFDLEKNANKFQIFDLTAKDMVAESKEVANYLYTSMSTLDFVKPLSEKKENTVINQNLQILRQAHVIGVLVECGFMTNEAEIEQLKNAENQKALAKAIADGIDAYFKAKEKV